MEKLKRYAVFLIGLFINSLGVSLITKADLGTSPISSIPYVLSLNFPLTLGPVSYTHLNYNKNIHIQDIADYIGITRSYLFYIFNKKLQMSPQKYLLKVMTPISNGGLIFAPPGHSTGAARGGISQTIFSGCPPL